MGFFEGYRACCGDFSGKTGVGGQHITIGIPKFGNITAVGAQIGIKNPVSTAHIAALSRGDGLHLYGGGVRVPDGNES